MRKAKIFIINGVILTITSFIFRGIGLIFNMYIARQITQEAIGTFGLIMSVYLFAITFACSGVGLAATCIISEELEKNKFENNVMNIVKICIFFSSLLGIIASFVLSIFAPVICKTLLHNSITNRHFYLIALVLPLISISSVISSYFTSTGKSYKNAFIQGFELLSKIIATILLLHNRLDNSVDTVCYCLVLGDVISEFISFLLKYAIFYFDRKKYNFTRNYIKTVGKKILKISCPIAITSYIRSGLSSLQQFLIPMRLQLFGLTYSVATAKYGLITGMVMPVLLFANFFITSFSGLLIPEYARLLAGKNFNRMKTVCNKIFTITFSFSFLVAGILLFYSDEISLMIYQNLEIAPYLRLLAPIVIVMYVDNIIDNILKGMQAQFHVMCVNICDLIITIGVIYFCVPIYGINGYLMSIAISEIFNFVLSFLLLKKKLEINFDLWNFVLKPCLSLFPCLFLCSIFPIKSENIFLYTCIKIGLFIAFYILFFGINKKKELFSF